MPSTTRDKGRGTRDEGRGGEEIRLSFSPLAPRPSSLALALLLLAALPLRAAPPFSAETFPLNPNVTLRVESDPEGESAHGYFPYVFVLTSTSKQKHEVVLRIPALASPRGQDNLRALTKKVTLEAGGTMRVVLRQPAWPPVVGSGLNVSIDGREVTREEGLPVKIAHSSVLSAGSYYGGYHPRTGMPPGTSSTFTLASSRVPRTIIDMISGYGPGPGWPGGARFSNPASGMGRSTPVVVHPLPVSQWSKDSLDYSRYDGIFVTADDLRDSATVPAGLWQYVENGGVLVVFGPGKVPSSWKPTEAGNLSPGLTRYEPGFGACLVTPSEQPADSWKYIPGFVQQTPAPWQSPSSIDKANEKLPVVEDVGIPVRGLLILMLLFTVIIGPLNFWFVARKGRRIWLLWTVPAISFVTCTAVFGYMILAEGWSGHVRSDTFTVIDHVSGRASTIGWIGFYSPLTPSGGLHFSTETELFPQRLGDWRDQRSQGTPCTLDWSQDQHLESGWVTARIPAHFQVRKGATARQRVNVTRDAGGTPTALNALGADVRSLWYADEQGRIFTAKNVTMGASTPLAATNSTLPVGRSTRLRDLYAGDWLIGFSRLHGDPVQLLRPGSYVAVLDASPFLNENGKDEGLANASDRRHRSLVLGLLQGEKDAR